MLDNPWELPGGKLEDNEDYFTALKREVKEETNLDIEIGEQLADWVIESKEKDFRIDGRSWLCKPINHDITLSREHSEFKWVAERGIQKIKIANAFMPVIKSWIELR